MGRPKELSDEERAKLIADGYQPIEIWVRDVDNESYRADARHQAEAAAAADVEDRVMEWIEAVSTEAWDDL